MRAIEAAMADYTARKNQFIDIPEWIVDGVPLRIYWSLLTIEQRDKYVGRNDVDLIVGMARDASGGPMFDKEDKPKLRLLVSEAIVKRIAQAMISQGQVTDETVAADVKN